MEKYFECRFENCDSVISYYRSLISDTPGDVEDGACLDIDEKLLSVLRERAGLQDAVEESSVPSKVTVSHLKKGLIDEEKNATQKDLQENCVKEVSAPKFIGGDDSNVGAERGTAMHMFMQFARYEECERDCGAEADRLLSMGFIDKRQRELLDMEKLERFFASAFYSGIKSSSKIYREQRFNLDLDAFDTELSGDVLVQGVIDLFHENDDGTYTVVDFKTDRVFGDDAESVLIERHKDQLMYYKRAVEEMTGCEVKNTYIYSFSLMKEIEV